MRSTDSLSVVPPARCEVRPEGESGWRGRALLVGVLALTALLLPVDRAAGQSPEWSANLVIQPYPSPFLSDWERNPQIAQLTVFYTGQAAADFRVELIMRSAQRGRIGRAVSGTYPVPFGPHTQLLTNPEVVDWSSMDYEEEAADLARRTGVLPEGEYEACARILDLQGQLRAETCAPFTIVLPEPPELIAPENGGPVLMEQPVFQWTPIQVPPDLGLTYRVRIVERLEGQTPQTALQANIPTHEAEVADAPLLVYPLDALPLESGHEYVWQVEAVDALGRPITAGGRSSEIWTFRYGEEEEEPGAATGAGVLPDTLTLVPGVARLRGLSRADVRENDYGYTIDGPLTLEIFEPFDATADVEAEALQVTRSSLEDPGVPPDFPGGRLTGRLDPAAVPESITGPFVELTDVMFNPNMYLTLGGQLALPGAEPVELEGRLGLTRAGPGGILRAVAEGGDPLGAAGSDPVRLLLYRAAARFPGATLDVHGSLELFGRDVGCGNVSGTIERDGQLSASVLCAPKAGVPLAADSGRLRLMLAGVAGTIDADLTTGELPHDLTASAFLRLDGSGGAICGTGLDLTIRNGDVSATAVGPRCDASEGVARLDWLAFRLSGLGLDRFGYTAASGFDFAFTLDMEPEVPTVPGLELPALTGVTAGPDGLAIPASSMGAQPAVPLAGYAVEIGGIDLPTFTLSWTDWNDGVADGFRFGLDATVRMPGLPPTAPGCLAGGLETGTAELADGRLRADLVTRTFEDDGCVLPLSPETGLALESLGGTLAIGLAPEPAPETLPSVTGSLTLPSYFACPAGTGRLSLGTEPLRLGPRGGLTGTVTGLSPPCPIELAALGVRVEDATLELAAGDTGQSATLEGGASGEFTAAGSPVPGTGSIAIDLVAGRMMDGELVFDGPFQLDLPRDDPVFSFRVREARLDTTGLHIDGRNELLLPDGSTVGTTFDGLTVNPLTLAISSGRVLFDAPFGLQAAIDDAGGLDWVVADPGADLTVARGFRVDLPAEVALDSAGLQVEGTGAARLVYGGRDLDGLEAVFTPDFAMALAPFGVGAGRMELRREGIRVAYVDRLGFHPSFAYFGVAVLPDHLGLPSEDVAYVDLRAGPEDTLRVRTETTADGLRVYTPAGATVPLVLPALQLGRATAPRVDVPLDITLDELGEGVVAGRIDAAVPAAAADAFDLAGAGVPFAIDSLAYEPGSAYRFTLSGILALFGERLGVPGDVELTLDGTGQLAGDVFFRLDQRVRLVPGSDRVTLALDSVAGAFDAALLGGGPYGFSLDAMGALELATETPYRVETTVRAADTGVTVPRIEAPDEPGRIDLGDFGLGVRNARVEYLAFSEAAGWDFELIFDVHLDFPGLGGLELPPVEAVSLRPDGFRIPEYEVPELHADTFVVGGFGFTPLAFRMGAVHYDWFTGAAPSDWGFGFDLELSLSNLPASTPAALRAVTLSVLDAGYSDGSLTGDIEPRVLGTPIEMPVGDGGGPGVLIDRLAGTLGELVDVAGGSGTAIKLAGEGLGRDGTGGLAGPGGAATGPSAMGPRLDPATDARQPASLQEPLTLTMGGAFVLPEAMQCAAAPGDTVALGDAELTLSSEGLISGRAADFTPPCPLVLGPLALEITTSELIFDISSAGQEVELDLDGTLALPAPSAGDTVRAAGSIAVDLVRLRTLRGSIAVAEPFRWDLPVDDPVLSLTVNEGLLDARGLHLTGTGGLALAGGSTVGVRFSDLTLGLPDFGITAGSAGFDGAFGFRIGIGDGGLAWETVDPAASLPAGDGLRMSLPAGVSLGVDGLRADGTATAALQFADTTFAALSVGFRDGFALGFDPVGVDAGRADFDTDEGRIAWVDSAGFHPGDIFAVVDLPERIGLPTEDVAYLVVADETGELVETESVADGIALRTRSGEPVELVIPALASVEGDPGTAPRIGVEFEVVVNPGDFDFVSGSVRAVPGSGESYVLSLADLGIPLDVSEIAYDDAGDGYGLRLAADLRLPDALGGLDVAFRDVTVDGSGLSGTAEVGRYGEAYDPGAEPAGVITLGSDVELALYGARATFSGRSAGIDLAAAVMTPLFAAEGGEPEPLFFNAGVGPGGAIDATIDPPASALPVRLAEFEPMPVGGSPAIGLDVAGSDFDLTLSGRLSIPAVSDGFAVSIAGLTLGTGGIDIPDVSISTGDDPQELELFGATFRLRDVGGSDPAPALAFSYGSGVLTATMSGELDFLDNTTSFRGLSVGSDGSIAIDALNLLSEGVTIVSGVLVLDTLKIEDEALVAGLEVTLPEPLDAGGPQRARFSVASDGEVTGGARIALINEEQGLGDDRTTAELGIATVHPHYVALNLSVGGSSSGAVEVASDLYIQGEEENVIRVGEKDGGTVDPGLVIGFDGDLDWGPFALDGAFDFDFEAVRLTIDNVASVGDPGEFAVGIGGELSVNVAVVSGGIGFEEFVVTETGEIDFGTEGLSGELSVAEVLTLELYDLSFSRGETELAVMGGDMPTAGGDARGTSAEETVTVSSYFSFGGSLTISTGGEDGALFSGGVEQFLFYRQIEGDEETTHIVVREASLGIQSGSTELLQAEADLIYDELAGGGFHMALGATARVVGQEVNLVGFIEKDRGDVSAGIFVAADIRIDLGYVTILRLGGGFFYEPRPEHIDLVYSALDMSAGGDSTIRPASDRPDPGKFAIFLYGQLAVIDDALVRGDVLLTITQRYFAFDAEIILLDQEGTIGGEAHLTVGFDDVYVEGNVLVYLDYGAAVQAEGRVEFYAYGGGTWGVLGEANVSVVSFIEISTKVFFGNPGFVADFEAGAGFDFWIVSIKTGIKTTVWYANEAPKEFGAYVEFYVHAKVLKGVVAAKGRLYGALVISGSPELLAGASLSISVIGISWSGSVWVSISSGGLDGGFGSDPRLEEILSRAQEIRDEITSARDEIEEAIEEAAFAASLVGLTEEELEAAYARIQESPLAAEWLLNVRAAQELRYDPQSGEESYYDWFIPTLLLQGAPDDRGQPLDAARDLESLKREMDELEPGVRERLSAIEMALANVRGDDAPTLAGNPARLNIPDTRTTRVDTLADGTVDKVLETPVDADVDASAARDQRTAMADYSERVASLDEQFRQQISAMEDGLATVRAATTGEEGSILQYARLHSQVTAATEAGFATQVAYFHRRQYWVLQRRVELADRRSTIDRIAADKAAAMSEGSLPALRNLIEDRLDAFDALLGNEGDARLVAEFREAVGEYGGGDETGYRNYLETMADSSAMLLWYNLGRVGLEVSDDTLAAQRAALVNTAEAEVDTIQASQRQISARFDRIYAGQAELMGSLYDLIDRYLYWHAERLTDTTVVVPDDPDLDAYRDRRAELAESFEVPRVTNLTVSVRNHGYWTERQFSWAGWHPSGGSGTTTGTLGGLGGREITLTGLPAGVYEYSFIDRRGSSGSLATLPELSEIQFLSNGGSGSLTRYSFLTTSPARISWPGPGEARGPRFVPETREYHREFFGRVRGGAGFTGFRPLLYDVTYGDGSSVTGGREVIDEGGPRMLWVRLPGLTRRSTYERDRVEQELWVPGFSSVRVAWKAIDPESGVRAYAYGVAMSEDTANVFEMVDVGGRRSVTINLREYDIPADTAIYVHVRAQNGAGGWSTFMSTPPIRADTTPPEMSDVRVRGVEPDLNWDEKYRLGNEFVPSDADEACTVPEPDYPRSEPVTMGYGGIGVATGGGLSSTTSTWSGSFSSSGVTSSISVSTGGLTGLGVDLGTTGEPASARPRSGATDAESRVEKFYYRVSTEPDTVFSLEGWTELDAVEDPWGEYASNATDTVTIQGPPLNYADEFYVSMVAVNYAGLVSEVAVSDPFTPTDPTPPEAPTFCAGYAPSGERLKVDIRNPAREWESGVKGYQYRVRIGERIVRSWPDSTEVDWEGAISGGETRTTDALGLESGRRYHVDVRAVNRNEQVGFMGSSGPVLVDLSAPPRPTVSPSHYVFSGRHLVFLTINAPDDPESGLMTQQVAIGSTRYSADIEPWQDLTWSRAGRFTTVIGTPELESGQTYWVHFRTVNGAGEPSRIYRTTFEAR